MQLNPIIVREFRARWRSWRAFAIVLGYAMLLALAVGLLYAGNVRTADVNTMPARRMAQIGHDLFLSLTAMQVFAWMLLAPALTATSIAGEREEGMLDLLQMSPLSPWRIVWGKMQSALAFIFLMMLAPLPITALCFLMGGVSPGEFFVAILLQSMTAVLGAVVGLFCSAWCRRAGTALSLAFSIMCVWGVSSAIAGSVSAPTWPGKFWIGDIGYFFTSLWGWTNPIVFLFSSNSSAASVTIGPFDMPGWAFAALFEAVVAVVLLKYATHAVRRPLQESFEKPLKPHAARDAATREPATAIGAARSTPVPRRSIWWEASWARALKFSNPVLQREVQRKLRFRRPSRNILRLLFALSGLGVFLYLWGLLYALGPDSGRDGVFIIATFFYLVAALVAVTAMSATAFPRERESHTWESLRLSLLTPVQLISGKLIPVVATCWVITSIVFLLLVPCITTVDVPNRGPGVSIKHAIAVALIVYASIWCYACWGLRVSWWYRRSWIAVTATIASLIFALVFLPIFLYLITDIGQHSGDIGGDFLRFWHPVFAMLSVHETSYSWTNRRLGLRAVVIPFLFFTFSFGWICLIGLYCEMLQSMRAPGQQAGQSKSRKESMYAR